MTTVKGLLKGLRYISQIFENEKEEEMQIGLPTDVKHVAHIGNDGPSANSPSWMNDFQGSSEAAAASGAQNCNGKANSTQTTKSSTKDIQKSWNGPMDSPERRSGKMKQPKRHPHTSSNGSMGSPAREPLNSSKPRRNKNTSATTASVESPRRQQNSSTGLGSSSQDPNVVPKPSRRKKSKGGGGSIRSRAKESSDSLTDTFPYSPGPGYEMTNSGEICQKPVYDEGKDCDEISRGIRAL